MRHPSAGESDFGIFVRLGFSITAAGSVLFQRMGLWTVPPALAFHPSPLTQLWIPNSIFGNLPLNSSAEFRMHKSPSPVISNAKMTNQTYRPNKTIFTPAFSVKDYGRHLLKVKLQSFTSTVKLQHEGIHHSTQNS